jgi:hypothetical protein
MRKKSYFICIALLITVLPLIRLHGGEEVLKLRVIPSPNLLLNGGFNDLDGNGLPQKWFFDNCSNSPNFRSRVINDADGNYLAIDSEWIKFGYWLQKVSVEEGKAYLASCDVRSNGPRTAMWIQCNATKKAVKSSPGKLKYIISRALRYGDELKEILKDFVDEDLIINLSPVNWNRLASEVIIPRNVGIKTCSFRVGIYGGEAGQAHFRNLVFREQKAELKAEIIGANWVELRIPGAIPEKVKLNPTLKHQTVSFVLPKAPHSYKVELLGSSKRKVVKEISNE